MSDGKDASERLTPGDPSDGSGNYVRRDAIALKYLELARAESLERLKIANQALIVYAGGMGAVAAFLLQERTVDTWLMARLGMVVPFLALAASWILYHNENMVNALAIYQIDHLSPYFRSSFREVEMWETSGSLARSDGHRRVYFTQVIEFTLLASPAVVFSGWLFYYSCGHYREHKALLVIMNVISLLLTAGCVFLSRLKIRERRLLRERQIALQVERDSIKASQSELKTGTL